jgi:hypothetical protein
MNPKYPIYIPSKGRAESRLTMKALDKISVLYKVVVEPSEFESYAKVIDKNKIIVLPADNMKLLGSRVWIMEYSISLNEERHWQVDDNIDCFYRLNKNEKIKVSSGTIFRCMEDFVDRYENIAIAGPNYDFFAKARQDIPAYYLNTRVYSTSLINNKIPFRHRRIYNDDTDICLCALKAGWCTVQFNAFLQGKSQTMSVSGGNTEQLYTIQDGRLKMAQSLVDDHPDVATITWKFGRWQHQVDYSSFKKNKLIKKEGVIIPQGINNYGMILKTIKEENNKLELFNWV